MSKEDRMTAAALFEARRLRRQRRVSNAALTGNVATDPQSPGTADSRQHGCGGK